VLALIEERVRFVRWSKRKKQEGYGTGKEGIGWSSMWMARDKLLANAPCHPSPVCRRHNAD
jgi:hypothetical protein